MTAKLNLRGERAKGSMTERHCACGDIGCFGLSWPIEPVEIWFCPRHKPADYYTRGPK